MALGLGGMADMKEKSGATGPKPGKSHGRNRNTAINAASKNKPDYGPTSPAQPFPVGPSSAVEYAMQANNLRFNFRVQQSALKAQAALARQAFQNQKQSINAGVEAGISNTGEELVERGLIGSASHLQAEEGVRAQGASQLTAAREALIQARMSSYQGRLQNRAQLHMGLGELAIRRAAEQRELALNAFASGGMNPWGYSTNTGV